MLRCDWLSNYQAICYSPLVAKSIGFENQNNDGWIAFLHLKLFCLDIFDQLVDFTKTIIPLALMASEQGKRGYWLRAWGIIVKYYWLANQHRLF